MQPGTEYQRMVEFVRNYFDSRDPVATSLKIRFPFRKRFEHCLRCSVWTQRIAISENADVKIAAVSALFHDIGKSGDETERNHGETGAEICRKYLDSIHYDADMITKIEAIVRNHSNRAHVRHASLEAKIVSDADLLDETGAVTVLWDAMACAGEDEPSYEKACDKIAKTFIRLKTGLPDKLHTQTGRRILEERLQFLNIYLKNLEYELGRIDITL